MQIRENQSCPQFVTKIEKEEYKNKIRKKTITIMQCFVCRFEFSNLRITRQGQKFPKEEKFDQPPKNLKFSCPVQDYEIDLHYP